MHCKHKDVVWKQERIKSFRERESMFTYQCFRNGIGYRIRNEQNDYKSKLTHAHLIEMMLQNRAQCVQSESENVTHLTMQIGRIKSVRNGTHPKKRRLLAHIRSYSSITHGATTKKLVQSSNKTYDYKI